MRRLILTALAVIAIAMTGVASVSATPPGNDGNHCHGANMETCRPDPQPSRGQDCAAHGNNPDGNDDHCSTEVPSSEPSATPSPSVAPSAAPSATPSASASIGPDPEPSASLIAPSSEPSFAPSVQPSAAGPTDQPIPTGQPVPTAQPTEVSVPNPAMPPTDTDAASGSDIDGGALVFFAFWLVFLGITGGRAPSKRDI